MKRETKFGKKSSPALKIESKKKSNPKFRNPLMELNCISSSSTTSSSCSSFLSAEAPPKSCLSFFLSNSSSKNHLQRPNKPLPVTPKSAPNARLIKPRSRSKPPTKIPETPTFRNLNKAKKETPFPKQCKNGKNSSFRATPASNPKPSPVMEEKNLASGHFLEESSRHQKWAISRMMVDTGDTPDQSLFSFGKSGLEDRLNYTPVNKLASGYVLEITPAKESMEDKSIDKTTTTATATTTPPVQASISPEIQCGSSVTSTTASCFGAGHVLSGITDKRKCRPRGILTVGEDLVFSKARVSDGDSDDESFLNNFRVSLIPAPSEASMRWLLSPCKEEEELKGKPQNGSPELRRLMGPTPFHSLSSPSSAHGFSSDACGNSNSCSKNSTGAKRQSLNSPSGFPEFEGFAGLSQSFLQIRPPENLGSSFPPSSFAATTSGSKAAMLIEDRGHQYEFATENSPLSIDSLGSHNAICTPHSDSSSDRHIGFSWMKNTADHRELDLTAEVLRTTSFSPQSRISRWDPADVLPLPGLNFQFANSTPPSNISDQVEIQKTRNDRALGISSSSFENLSQSQMRISWREGLVSRIFNMDELDCCRCLSDEEEDLGVCGNNLFSSDFNCRLDMSVEDDTSSVSATTFPEFVSEEPGNKGKSKMNSPLQKPSSCSESISTEGGCLIASGDSDWNLCYKNQLFRI